MVNLKDIEDTRKKINEFIHHTPLIFSNSFSRLTGRDVYLKAENLQKTGSFKVRGAFRKLLGIKNARKIITASMGNHAQGIAFAAASLGFKAKIVMPITAPIIKSEATRAYGAEVVFYGRNYSDSLSYAVKQKGYIFIHSFDDPEIIQGQGTVGLEVTEDLKDMDTVVVPVGGGGLISGVAIAIKEKKPKVKVIGVQAEAAISAYLSFRKKKIVEHIPEPTIADGIAVGRAGEITMPIINRYVDDIVTVSEEAIARAILLFLERKKLIVEGAGATPLASMLEEKIKTKKGRVVLIVSGGNIDVNVLDRIILKGLSASGRIAILEIILSDTPGSLASLTDSIASRNANILNILHDRLSGDLPLGKTRVTIELETRGFKHIDEIVDFLSNKGFNVKSCMERAVAKPL